MKPKESNMRPEKIPLNGRLSEFRQALEEEIDEVKKSGASSTLLNNGQKMEGRNGEYWYRFDVEYLPNLPADTPCKLKIGNEQFDVTVISFEDNSLMLSSKIALPDTLGKATLENGSTVLMERLIKCIEENVHTDNPAGNRMFMTDGHVYISRKKYDLSDLVLDGSNTESQQRAIRTALTEDITYIWGPPGTGKTTVIGQIIEQLYQHNRTVLVVSHTNTAVDGAIKKAAKAYGDHPNEPYPILRIGAPGSDVPDRAKIASHVDELGRDLTAKQQALEQKQHDNEVVLEKYAVLTAKHKWLQENKLSTIEIVLEKIDALSDTVQQITDRIAMLNASIEKEMSAHPEHAQYESLTLSLQSKKEEFQQTFLIHAKLNQEKQKVSNELQEAESELRKHTRYAVLREQESKCLTAPFLNSEINATKEKIANLQAETKSSQEKQDAAQHVLSDYAKKNTLAKLFVSKNTLQQAQDTIASEKSNQDKLNEQIRQTQNLLNSYQKQLDELKTIQAEMQALAPTQSSSYWELEFESLTQKSKTLDMQLIILSTKKESLVKEIADLKLQISRAESSYESINNLKQELQNLQQSLTAKNTELDAEVQQCSNLFIHEATLFGSFYTLPPCSNNHVSCHLLIEQKEIIQRELADAPDIDAISREINHLKEEIQHIQAELTTITQKMQELEKQAIMNAKIVGATLAKTYLSDILRERKFDTVILDEASMASIPALWCASYLAKKCLVIVGDFLQLPPIVMANTPMAQKWLGQDIFYHSGMQTRAKDRSTCPSNFVMLNNQFRMEAAIADIANMYYGEYGGLKSDDGASRRCIERDAFYQWYIGKRSKYPIHLIDTESLHAWVTGIPQGRSNSRLNCFSAVVDVDLAFKLLDKKFNHLSENENIEQNASVLIVAPYKPHVMLINKLIELEYKNRGLNPNHFLVKAGTIHPFQGSEADIVIFDLVVDEPHWKANLFIPDSSSDEVCKAINDNLRRMFNVAVTRAKFQLFMVGNFSYCEKRAKGNALGELLEYLLHKKCLPKEDAKRMLPNLAFSKASAITTENEITGKHLVCQGEVFDNYFLSDVKHFKKRLIIYSAFMTTSRISRLLGFFADAIHAGKQIIVITKAHSDRGKRELPTYRLCEKQLKEIGVTVIHKKKMHEKLIFVDSAAIWTGSLNALSFTGETGEVMERHADQTIVANYEQMFDIDPICGAVERVNEQSCPCCGREMVIQEGGKGGIYWKCSNEKCGYTRSSAQVYPTNGEFRCSKCGAAFKFEMKKEPRWICTRNPKHFQKIKPGDLKLKKMAGLIPTEEDLLRVKTYLNIENAEEMQNADSPSDDTPSESENLISVQISMF